MRVAYDPEADALYLYLTPRAGEAGAAAEAVEIAPNVNADDDAAGALLGIEVLPRAGCRSRRSRRGRGRPTDAAA